MRNMRAQQAETQGLTGSPENPHVAWQRRIVCLFLFAMSLYLLVACANKPPLPVFPSVMLSLDGPPLAIAGDMEGHFFAGHMERACMAGVGRMVMQNQTLELQCKGGMDQPASEKGRLYAQLDCTGNRTMRVAFRNMGPDQGVGVGRVDGDERVLVFFYHPWSDEANRRIREVKANMLKGKQTKVEESVEQLSQ